MKRKIVNGARVLLTCLCAALLCSGAFAKTAEVTELGNTEKEDGILGACSLPSGGVVFAGYTYQSDNPEGSMARLLCLNPDRTVRWIYAERDRRIDSYGPVAVTENGELAALCGNGYCCVVKFFTLDGEPTGKQLSLDADGFMYELCPAGVIRTFTADDAKDEYTEFLDWDGSVLFRTEWPGPVWSGSRPAADREGLVLDVAGAGEGADGTAMIVKVDYRGNVLWETALPSGMEGAENAYTGSCVQTGDGGYLVTLLEFADRFTVRKSSLVRLGADGQVLWAKPSEEWFWLAAESGGKYAACAEQIAGDGVFTVKYLWYGADGSELETTEYRVLEEDIPPHTDREHLNVSVEELIPMADGLWQEICFWGTDEPEEEEPAWSRQDLILAPVPEL